MQKEENFKIVENFDFGLPGHRRPISIDVFEHVYSPREDSFLLLDMVATLPLASSSRFLEVGVGTGIVSIFAARCGAEVTGTDINPWAVKNAEHNAERNGISLVVKCCDLFDEIAGKFDIIMFNPPYLPHSSSGGFLSRWERSSIESGKHGIDATIRFLKKCPTFMADGGSAYFIASSLSDIRALERTPGRDLRLTVVRHIHFHGERLFLYCLERKISSGNRFPMSEENVKGFSTMIPNDLI